MNKVIIYLMIFVCLVRLFPLHRWRFSEKQDSGDLVAKWHGCFMKTILLPLIFVCSVELDWQKLWYTQCYFVMLNVVWRSIETERYINVKCWIYRCGSSGECHLIINTVSSVCRAHPLDPPQTHSSCFNSFPFFWKKKCYSASTINIKHAFRTKTACIQRTEKNPKVLPVFNLCSVSTKFFKRHCSTLIWYDKTYVINVLWWKKKDNSWGGNRLNSTEKFFNELFVIV